MKQDTILIVAAAGLGLYLISRMIKPGAIKPPIGGGTVGALNNNGNAPVTEISNGALPGQPGYAWRYYSDGTSISPAGDYYLNGNLVYSQGAGSMSMGGSSGGW